MNSAPHSLTEIGNQVKTDKATQARSAHGYTLVYEALFEPLRERPLALLEFGLCIGGPETGAEATREVTGAPSLALWQDYFRQANIYGFDISDFTGFQNDRFSFRQGDCGKLEDLAGTAEWKTDFDIIIDDASHASFHQLLTFQEMFGRLKPGGLYIIEDTHWQPQMIEQALPPCPKASEVFGGYQKSGQWPSFASLNLEIFQAHGEMIASCEVYRQSDLELLKDQYKHEQRYMYRSDTLLGRARRAMDVAVEKSPRAGLKDLLLDPVKLIVLRKAARNTGNGVE